MNILPRSGKKGASRLELFTTAPYVAVVVFALAMLTIVWMLQTQEALVERNALGRDVQWAERTMRTHFLANEDFLNELARSSRLRFQLGLDRRAAPVVGADRRAARRG